MARYLKIGEKQVPGLADIVDNPNRPLRDAIVDAKPHRFDVMLAGSTVAPIHELLRSPRLGTLLQEARAQYDYVLLDTPPLGPVSDCALLARMKRQDPVGGFGERRAGVVRDRKRRAALPLCLIEHGDQYPSRKRPDRLDGGD